jgi:holin-like protein
MVLLFIGLSVRGEPPAELANLAHGLLRHLSLLFVPAGVGVISYIGLLAEAWLPITLTLITSVLLAIVVTGVTLRLLQRRDEAPDDG